MIILGGSSCQALATKVAEELGTNAARLEIRRFPDGEKYLRILDDVKGNEVVVIQSIHHTPDELLFEYLLIVDALKDLGANKVHSFIPYFAYARQDERFNAGEALSFKTVAKLMRSVGTDELFTIDMHQHRVLKSSEVFGIPSHDLSAMPLLAEYAQATGELDHPLVIGPDADAERWAKLAADQLKTDYDVFEKKRLSSEIVDIRPRKSNAKERDVLIVDDIISTGGTIVQAAKILFGQGARKVVVACTHPILAGDALEKIHQTGAAMIVGTDTIPGPISFVSVAPLIAQTVKTM
ncbi:MAG TPA: ribose-phosphate diphosphokinase [Candidatus Saccharimonadales bacterium]|nr:ribose-phosphate diphosphokinase [Candidatus Saccharimonadales bacterium]